MQKCDVLYISIFLLSGIIKLLGGLYSIYVLSLFRKLKCRISGTVPVSTQVAFASPCSSNLACLMKWGAGAFQFLVSQARISAKCLKKRCWSLLKNFIIWLFPNKNRHNQIFIYLIFPFMQSLYGIRAYRSPLCMFIAWLHAASKHTLPPQHDHTPVIN